MRLECGWAQDEGHPLSMLRNRGLVELVEVENRSLCGLMDREVARHRFECVAQVDEGEPLNPEVIEQVQKAWGLTIRDGFGQTETTAQVGNPPGASLKPGSMGRPLPGTTSCCLTR